MLASPPSRASQCLPQHGCRLDGEGVTKSGDAGGSGTATRGGSGGWPRRSSVVVITDEVVMLELGSSVVAGPPHLTAKPVGNNPGAQLGWPRFGGCSGQSQPSICKLPWFLSLPTSAAISTFASFFSNIVLFLGTYCRRTLSAFPQGLPLSRALDQHEWLRLWKHVRTAPFAFAEQRLLPPVATFQFQLSWGIRERKI
jgi:hypothetical protein